MSPWLSTRWENPSGLIAYGIFPAPAEGGQFICYKPGQDYLLPTDDQQLHAAGLDLGAHDHWDGFATQRYSLILYIQLIRLLIHGPPLPES